MKKALFLASLLILTGCGMFETFSERDEPYGYDNAYDLKAGRAYVWINPDEEDIRNDLSQERKGNEVFFACPVGNLNFKASDLSDSPLHPRSIWISSDKDNIPTLTGRNALIYISEDKVPDEIVFIRFADYGYSVGISNLIEDAGGHYYLIYQDTDEDDYKYSIDLKSDAADLSQFEGIGRLYLDKVGDMKVTEENVSGGGTVTGLENGEHYRCEFYTGTYYQDFLLCADIHTFGEMERFICHGYEFLHSDCIQILIPEWFKSGYYFVQGAGLFRYVDEKDLKRYNGDAYDPSINWNEPIKEYDGYGVCIYDPSCGIDRREER